MKKDVRLYSAFFPFYGILLLNFKDLWWMTAANVAILALAAFLVLKLRKTPERKKTFPKVVSLAWLGALLTDAVALLYAVDTSTGVCPSLHAAGAIGIASAWLKSQSAARRQKAAVVLAAVLICLSTVFIKQHSVVDVFAALPLCLLAETVAYGHSYWLPRLKKRR